MKNPHALHTNLQNGMIDVLKIGHAGKIMTVNAISTSLAFLQNKNQYRFS
jgi:hypothetical protein